MERKLSLGMTPTACDRAQFAAAPLPAAPHPNPLVRHCPSAPAPLDRQSAPGGFAVLPGSTLGLPVLRLGCSWLAAAGDLAALLRRLAQGIADGGTPDLEDKLIAVAGYGGLGSPERPL